MCFIVTDHGLDYRTGKRRFEVFFDEKEAAALQLDALDRAVINTPIGSVADIFQDWQILAFRWQQQFPPTQDKGGK